MLKDVTDVVCLQEIGVRLEIILNLQGFRFRKWSVIFEIGRHDDDEEESEREQTALSGPPILKFPRVDLRTWGLQERIRNGKAYRLYYNYGSSHLLHKAHVPQVLQRLEAAAAACNTFQLAFYLSLGLNLHSSITVLPALRHVTAHVPLTNPTFHTLSLGSLTSLTYSHFPVTGSKEKRRTRPSLPAVTRNRSSSWRDVTVESCAASFWMTENDGLVEDEESERAEATAREGVAAAVVAEVDAGRGIREKVMTPPSEPPVTRTVGES